MRSPRAAALDEAAGSARPEGLGARRLRVLIVTKIFPNAAEPLSSPFNRQQFAALGRRCDVEVLATIPWFPGARLFRRWSAAGRLVDVPRADTIDGLAVRHPRFLFVPRIGQGLSGTLYAASLLPLCLRERRRFDVVLGSWAYPDGVAAVALGALLSIPSVVKLHGSDINVLARRTGPRRNLRLLLPRAGRVVAVSRALADAAERLGVARERIAVVPNGVDGALFHRRDRAAARAALGLPADGKLVVYAGRLEREKGVLDLIGAFARLASSQPGLRLALVGDGGAAAECRAQAAGFGERVRIVGARPLEEMPLWMAASDLVALPSWNEGTPNVLLEAQACGRPSVATSVGGIPEVVRSPALGELVPPRQPQALAAALVRCMHACWDEAAIASAAPFDWDQSAARLHDALLAAVDEHRARA